VRITRTLPFMRGYDVVQLINPIFFELKPERLYPIYRYLRRNNRHVFLGAYGMDYYWVKTCLERQTFRYSDFNIGSEIRQNADNDAFIAEWLNGAKGELNRFIAEDCDGIVSGLYEYDACYRPAFPDKTQFIPFPINLGEVTPRIPHPDTDRIRFFIGIQRQRDAYKGTDIMYQALVRLADRYPDRIDVKKTESVPFVQYNRMIDHCDVLLDQLYSDPPAMNALLAMAKGLVVVGGGEEENYALLGEKELRPIVNVLPSAEDVYARLEDFIQTPGDIARRSKEGVLYVERHHDHKKVAAQYVDFWNHYI
ncbi:MAG: glycosyltransferase family 1 protein, partial [Paraprevotella sp.]|nr:glycosyltransferase family 1 protein [Paraprevotella sp.]